MLITVLLIQIQQSGWDSVPTGTICCVWHCFDTTPKLSHAGARAWRNISLLLLLSYLVTLLFHEAYT